MFKCGDLIVYGNNGVCRVEDITTLDNDAAEKDKQYYVLKNLLSNGTAYIPVDSGVYMRGIMSVEEVNTLIDSIPAITTEMFDHIPPRETQNAYRKALLTHDCKLTLALIKHIRNTAKLKQLQKKKLSATEDRFLEQACKIVGSEFSAALGIELENVEAYIKNRVDI